MKVFTVVTLILFLPILQVACGGPESPEEVETKIAHSEVLTRLDRLCSELPRPSGFEFVYKKISGNSFTVSISYQYRSRLPYSDVYDFYSRELRLSGWVVGPSGYYEKGQQQVSVSTVEFPGANYSVYCAEVN